MSNSKYKIGFYVLLAINLALVGLFVFRPKVPMPQKDMKEEISLKLNLTEAQKAIFFELAEDHRETIDSLERQQRAYIESLFSQLITSNADRNKTALLQEILQLEEEKITVTYAHFESLKSICTEEQLESFDEVILRIVPALTNSPGRPGNPARAPR
ncbi:Spy/CpxP family protein refolding chaperone [Pontibacter oryzae]|uniref:Periplasmic heavy metal sensor n=1 Tax=Pontibacter oryzae TaxID=2304593 RepID=A0A399SFH9_9BACT|nr:periplasmic heavy metal sensor [Pontibacter oryzae]RIJ42896.1 periplasmic heavy metal sensor [Pontibacter oryzae]